MAEQVYFQWYDYVVFGLTIVISLGIGVYFAVSGGKQRTLDEYLVAGRRMSWVPVALSMLMSNVSATLLLGFSAESYQYGMLQWIGQLVPIPGDVVYAAIFVPFFYRMKLTSIFQYYQWRFGSSALTLTATTMFLINQLLYIGLCLYAPAVALAAVTGIDFRLSILGSSAVGLFYTYIGGMKAVVWTDTFQGVIFLAGITIVLVVGTGRAGGIQNVYDVAYREGRLNFFEWDANPRLRLNTYVLVLHQVVYGLSKLTYQQKVQRFCSTKSLRHARGSILLLSPLLFVAGTLSLLLGLICFVYYQQLGCDPIKSGQIRSANQILPFFIVNAVRIPCLPGLLLAVLFSGSLSSFSSSMNCASAIVWKDMLERRLDHLEERRKTLITKLVGLAYGIVGTAVSFLFKYAGGNLVQVAVTLIVGLNMPFLGIVVMGTMFSFANWIGVLVSTILTVSVSFAVLATNTFLNPYPPGLNTTTEHCSKYNITLPSPPAQTNTADIPPVFTLSYMLYSPMFLLLYVMLGVVISLLTGRNRRVDPALIIHSARRLSTADDADSGAPVAKREAAEIQGSVKTTVLLEESHLRRTRIQPRDMANVAEMEMLPT